MLDSFPTKLPDGLTYDAWDSGKAALTPETGVGKQLKLVAKAFSDLNKAPFHGMRTAKGPDDYEEYKKGMEAESSQFEKVWKGLDDLAKLAAEKAKSGKKSRLFPDKSVKLLEKIAAEAATFSDDLREYPGEAAEEARKSLEGFEERMQEKIKLVEGALQDMTENQKAAEKADKSIQSRLKEVDKAINEKNPDGAKPSLKEAIELAGVLGQLVQKCEKDSTKWRFDHSGTDKKNGAIIAEMSISIMNIRKNVASISAKATEAVKKAKERYVEIKK